MHTRIATAALTVMFLSAGAFAGGPHGHNQHVQQADSFANPVHMTVINKNMAWPLPGHISVETCKYRRCIDI